MKMAFDMSVVIKRKEINGICMLEIHADNGKKKPLVLIYHGFEKSKETMITQAYYLACEGFFAVLPDAYMHGERNPGNKKPDIFETVLKSSAEIDVILSSYSSGSYADSKNAGISGYSMGGFIIYDYLAAGKKDIKAAVAAISSPDWVSLLNTEWADGYFDERGIEPGSDKMRELAAGIYEIQPIGRYMKMSGIPLLMINAGRDTMVPPEGSSRLYELLYGLYEKKEDIALSLYKDAGHYSTFEMDSELVGWFVKHLGKGKA